MQLFDIRIIQLFSQRKNDTCNDSDFDHSNNYFNDIQNDGNNDDDNINIYIHFGNDNSNDNNININHHFDKCHDDDRNHDDNNYYRHVHHNVNFEHFVQHIDNYYHVNGNDFSNQLNSHDVNNEYDNNRRCVQYFENLSSTSYVACDRVKINLKSDVSTSTSNSNRLTYIEAHSIRLRHHWKSF